MQEMVVFINRLGQGFIVEGEDCSYSFEEFEFHARSGSKVDESLMEVDGWGVTDRLDMEKAFKPLKFYRIKWWEEDLNTPDGHSYYDIIEELEEVDYLNQ